MVVPLIAGNWKMHKLAAEAETFMQELSQKLPALDSPEVRIYPPYTALWAAAQAAKGSKISVGAQNVYYEDKGAFTGEISAAMLKEAGATSVIVGHSERRQLLGESDSLVAKKARKALDHGLKVILCVGETLEERQSNRACDIVQRQLDQALALVESEGLDIAYEPVWAIGTGRTASADQAQEMHAFIRKVVDSRATRILYGGSVKPENAAELMAQPDIDGLLVGGASLDVGDFTAIVAAAA